MSPHDDYVNAPVAGDKTGPGKPPNAITKNGTNDAVQEPDYAKTLARAMTMAPKGRSRAESVIAGGIQQRAHLFEMAFAQAKQGVREPHKSERDVLPREIAEKLASLDARHFAKLREPHHRALSALAIAETANLSAGYRKALAQKAPDVFAAVQLVMAAIETARASSHTVTLRVEPGVPRSERMGEALRVLTLTREPNALERGGADRAQDAKMLVPQRGQNGIEQITEQKQERRDKAENQRTPTNRADASQLRSTKADVPGSNQVASDEVFTASKDDAKPILPPAVEDKYLRVGTKFYHPNDTRNAAFEDKGNKLQTRSNSEHIAETMVAIARARGWDEIKVSGSGVFRREVWLEAVAHGMHVKGYTPSETDKAELAKRTRHLEANQASPSRPQNGRVKHSDSGQSPSNTSTKADNMETVQKVTKAETAARGDSDRDQRPAADRQRAQAFAQKPTTDALMDHPELAGTYAALASMKRKASADGLSPQQRAVVMARIEANLVNSIERGELPQLKVREQVEDRRERAKAREDKR